MKKIMCLGLSLCMVLCLGVSVFAAPNSMDNFKTTATYTDNFKDVPAEQWYAAPVKTCYEYGLMKGKSPTAFNPGGNLTVAEAIVMADRVHEIYTTGVSTLENAKEGKWYQTYVEYALTNGIVKDGDFANYNVKITRAEMAHIFYASLPADALPAINRIGTNDIPDVKNTAKYADEIRALYNAGVLTGSDPFGTFHPDDNIKRSEAATIISRVAIVGERKDFAPLVRKDSGDGLVLALPANTREDASVPGVLMYQDVAGGVAAILGEAVDESYRGISIGVLPPDALNDAIVASMQISGLELKDANSTPVSFGSVKAYRTTGYFATDEFGKSPAVIYSYITGNRLKLVCLIDYAGQNPALLKEMANWLTVDAGTVSPKL